MTTYNLPPGVSMSDVETLLSAAIEDSSISSGVGSFHGTYQTALSQFDRFGNFRTIPNTEKVGLTFITRPKLNLSKTSLRQSAIMATLATLDSRSLPFSIRCMLDTEFCFRPENRNFVADSPFVNGESPFIIPLTNTLQSISGWPDFVVDTETSEGGFFSEDQTIAKGSDFLNRTYDLTLTFRDIQGGYVMALMLYWIYWIALAARGIVTAYPQDISARRLSYTCSIYRFVLDPSMKTITKWAKATGCFPRALPIGNSFNVSEGETFLSSNMSFSIPFTVNHVEYMDPRIFQDFNTLMQKPQFAGPEYYKRKGLIAATNEAQYNFKGLPWIDTQTGANELKWMCYPEELDSSVDSKLEELRRKVDQRTRDLDRESLPTLSDTGTLIA